MGDKITIDSATMFNKALELIEACWLFGIEADRIRVVIHPSSIVHSMVELVDGSFKAQLSDPDMRHPIQYALTWPERVPSPLPPFDPVRSGPLEFFEPEPRRYPCLALAHAALRQGGAAPAVLNAANEVAVGAFLAGRLRFLDIAATVERVLQDRASDPHATLEDVIEADRRARETATRLLTQGART
jgi:1-deoxy-D-xylulose-5-phosphate reductoisomerase